VGLVVRRKHKKQMTKKIIKFILLNKNAKLPSYAHDGDAAFDIYSVENVTLKKRKVYLVKTGVVSEIPEGYFVSFRGKSGLAAKFGIDVLGGVIDSSYRGEWVVILTNLGQENYKIEKGDKIAQGLLQPAPMARIVEVKKLSETTRGEGKFGSTGKK
jgi:dUTP pyrophosphatase